MVGSRDDAILRAAVALPRPAVLVCVNLQNFKALNAVLGRDRGDALLERAERELGAVGRTWRTGGDEFVAIAPGTEADVAARARAFSWLLHVTVGATEAWCFRFADGRAAPAVPWRAFQLVCTPRCALVELGPEGRAEESLRLARERCERLREPGAALPDGFAPPAKGTWTNEVTLAERACPSCGARAPTVLEEDLGWSRERCAPCGATYERRDVLYVLGDASAGGYA